MILIKETYKTLSYIYKEKDLLIRLVITHYRSLYSGSRLGIYWIALGPLILLSLYSITYSLVYKIVLPNYSVMQYITSVYAGLILLLSCMNLLSSCTGALKNNFKYKSIGLNIEDIPIKIAITESVPLLIGFIFLIFLSIISTNSFWHILFFPIIFLLYFLFSVGIARFFTIISIIFKDFIFVIPYIGIILLLITPISYIPSMIPTKLKIIFIFNPIYYFCVFLQNLSIEGTINLNYLFAIILIATFLPLLGRIFFKRSLPLVRDKLSE